ncbi:hypothetical protein GCM10029964_059130 [Kibdelosporangium lantanae]
MIEFEPADPPRSSTFRIDGVRVSVTRALPVLLRDQQWAPRARRALELIADGRLVPAISPAGYDMWRIDGASGELFDAIADALPRTPAAHLVVGGPAYAAQEPQLMARDQVSLRLTLHDERFTARLWFDEWTADTILATRRAAMVWPVVERFLDTPTPEPIELTDAEVVELLQGGLKRLAAAGFAVHWPRDVAHDLTATAVISGEPTAFDLGWQFDLHAHDLTRQDHHVPHPRPTVTELDPRDRRVANAQVDPSDQPPTDTELDPRDQRPADAQVDPSDPRPGDTELDPRDHRLTDAELDLLAETHRPLVRIRDRWVLVDPRLAARARDRVLKPLSTMDAISATLTGATEVDGEYVPTRATGWLEALRQRIADPDAGEEITAPAGLAATLRDYQLRGLRWLDRMTSLGLGGCLADDMGLGKTITLIALHLHRAAAASPCTTSITERTAGAESSGNPEPTRANGPFARTDPRTDRGPRATLVVCPASLLGNWEREITRFAPGVPVRRFHGTSRSLDDLDGFVLTTYGTMRVDAEILAAHEWDLVVADEAQHVKNPRSGTAKALRTIPSAARVALTGTPVENSLAELWAILDWTTPGLLGPLAGFLARWSDTPADLAPLVRPFLLRRRKTDPGIAPELPAKTETDRPVALTREQAGLYQALVDETMAEIRQSSGIGRRGLIMALLTGLKQVCNHPAQYLKETDPVLPGRSGKLELLDELVDTILAENGAVLVFTQYVAMARLLEKHLADRGVPTQLLHGGTPVATREQMVRRFQDGQEPVFLLSLKAAGTGLNLTRADHVVHYDRWWNPAVEDQATDRAYRIGQTRPVQVHKLIAEGTLEDRIAELLRRKKNLADAVLGSGETALTELTDAELAELIELRGTW